MTRKHYTDEFHRRAVGLYESAAGLTLKQGKAGMGVFGGIEGMVRQDRPGLIPAPDSRATAGLRRRPRGPRGWRPITRHCGSSSPKCGMSRAGNEVFRQGDELVTTSSSWRTTSILGPEAVVRVDRDREVVVMRAAGRCVRMSSKGGQAERERRT